MDPALVDHLDRFHRRREVFIEEGLTADEAYELADQMFIRDMGGWDDRRVCFECAYHVDKKCTEILDKYKRPTMQLRFILKRCEQFKLKGTK
jgi:hypothetical protein